MAIRVELGCAGHYILSDSCQFRRHTQIIGPRAFRVSTVGDCYRPERKPIWSGSTEFFETMVFESTLTPEPDNEGCGCMVVKDYGSPEQCIRNQFAGDAQRTHEEMVEKYLKLSEATWEE